MDAATPGDGLRFAFGTLTAVPVRVPRWDTAAAARGMTYAPLVGLFVGGASAVLGVLLWRGAGPMVAAVASVALPAVLTRGLHLDGLADVADGLGSGRPPEDALRVMKQSDIGPFGVVTLLLTLLGQVAALTAAYGTGWQEGAAAAVLCGTTARTALTLASRTGVPAARPEGLGAAVAGAVPTRAAYATAAAVMLGAAGLGWSQGPAAALHFALAVLLALGTAELLLRHCRRRFGGVTGDVFGAVAECAATACLLLLVLR